MMPNGLLIRCDSNKDSRCILSGFNTGLRDEIQTKMFPFGIEIIEKMFQFVMNLSSYLRMSQVRRIPFKAMEPPKWYNKPLTNQ